MKLVRLVLVVLFALFVSRAARAEDGGSIAGCVETIPSGGHRPVLHDTFPERGLSGYAATLTVVVEHGKGEKVLPEGIRLQGASDAAKMLRDAGFELPDQDGGSAARVTPNAPDPARPDRASTTLELPLVALPKGPGRQTLVLPPLPIAVARASGDIATSCTRPHAILLEDPTASTPDAMPKPNPPGRAQREDWTALRNALLFVAVGAVIAAILALVFWRLGKRPKPVPPPPPPRPPWSIALERLDEVRHAGLLEVQRFDEYFDRVNDTLRWYLGARFGFDGLESTTDEILVALEHEQLYGLSFADVVEFLRTCDLVKFANVTPTPDECLRSLEAGERIVRATMPSLVASSGTLGPPPMDGSRFDPRGSAPYPASPPRRGGEG